MLFSAIPDHEPLRKGRMLLRKISMPPQSGQQGPRGASGLAVCDVGMSPVCFRIKWRISSALREQRGFINPKDLTFMNPEGRICWRKRRINSMTSRLVDR
jgi:hypothetical protein